MKFKNDFEEFIAYDVTHADYIAHINDYGYDISILTAPLETFDRALFVAEKEWKENKGQVCIWGIKENNNKELLWFKTQDGAVYDREKIKSYQKDSKLKKSLNTRIWNSDNSLKPEIKDQVEKVVEKFKEWLKEFKIDIEVEDIILVGSNASYNYNSKSDLDIHIIVPEADENILKLYDSYKTLFNKTYKITFNKIPVELYVHNDTEQLKSNSIYSIYKGWIKEPNKEEIKNIDISGDLKVLLDEYKQLLELKDVEKIKAFINKLYDMRKEAFSNEGDFAKGNLIFKEFRTKGYIKKLKDLQVKLESKSLSIGDVIKKESKGYVIYSKKGKRLSKPYKTKEEAENRLEEIEMFKHMKDDNKYKYIYDTILVRVKYYGKDPFLQEIPVINNDIKESIDEYLKTLGKGYSAKYVQPGKKHKNPLNVKQKEDPKYEQLKLFEMDSSCEDSMDEEEYFDLLKSVKYGEELEDFYASSVDLADIFEDAYETLNYPTDEEYVIHPEILKDDDKMEKLYELVRKYTIKALEEDHLEEDDRRKVITLFNIKVTYDSVKDTGLYIYQFPSDMTQEDIEALAEYHLEYLGKVGENGVQTGDHLVKGSKEDLELYCDKWIGGYVMHPDYLYKEEDFDLEDVLVKDEPVEIKSFAIYSDKDDGPTMEEIKAALDHIGSKIENVEEQGKDNYSVYFKCSEEQLHKVLEELDIPHEDISDFIVKDSVNDKVVEDAGLYIYQFPADMTEEDLEKLGEYNLELMGKVGSEGFQPGDFVVRGKLADLKRYCQEWIGGYEMHPDYLYKDGDFCEECLVEDTLTPADEFIKVLRSISVPHDSTFQYGSKNGLLMQIQNVGLDRHEEITKYPHVSPKTESLAWGRIWNKNELIFNEEKPINLLKQDMIKCLEDLRGEVHDTEDEGDSNKLMDLVSKCREILKRYLVKKGYKDEGGDEIFFNAKFEVRHEKDNDGKDMIILNGNPEWQGTNFEEDVVSDIDKEILYEYPTAEFKWWNNSAGGYWKLGE